MTRELKEEGTGKEIAAARGVVVKVNFATSAKTNWTCLMEAFVAGATG